MDAWFVYYVNEYGLAFTFYYKFHIDTASLQCAISRACSAN